MLENAKSTSSAAEAALETVGSYRIIREIGRGGMGVVFQAHHQGLGRMVALKLLPGRLSTDNRALARFQREARVIAKLHHSNIVPLYEVGQADGNSFLAMQLINGRSLYEIIEQTRSDARSAILEQSPESDSPDAINQHLTELRNSLGRSKQSSGSHRRSFHWVAELGCQAAEALDYAHHRGVVHRDVKPSNIILDNSGVIWLTDFGLAKIDDEELTQTGDLVGTVRYMAPERFKGQCNELADIYGLGLTLYELLTLQSAFPESDRVRTIDLICNSTLSSIRARNPRVPRDLETIVLKACDKDPRARYPSAQELANDLRRFVNDEPIHARRTTLIEQYIRWTRRNRGLSAALACIAALLLTMLAGSIAFSFHQSSLRSLAEQNAE